MKLQIFDFDETLFRTPPPNPGYIPKWYDLPASLDPDKYDIHCIDTVAKIARANHGDPMIKKILITRRIPELMGSILYILREHSIHLDMHFAIGHDTEKVDVLAGLLSNEYKDINFTEIEIYEDCLYQILEYNNFAVNMHYPNRIDFKYFFVDKTHLIQLPTNQIGYSSIIEKLKVTYA